MFAAPQIGLSKLLHVPSNERYGVLTHRCGGAAQRIDGPGICFASAGPGKKLLKSNEMNYSIMLIARYSYRKLITKYISLVCMFSLSDKHENVFNFAFHHD